MRLLTGAAHIEQKGSGACNLTGVLQGFRLDVPLLASGKAKEDQTERNPHHPGVTSSVQSRLTGQSERISLKLQMRYQKP